LRKTVYNVPADKYIRDGAESIIQARPTFDSLTRWAKTTLNYKEKDLLPAWDEFVKAAPLCKTSDGFQYDLVDITRQVMANYALPVQRNMVAAYRKKDLLTFKKESSKFIQLIDDIDRLLATRKDFMLGPWVSDARKWGETPAEKALYEMNAKDLITLWGDAKSPLNEYACRQWSGLLNDFYKVRWQKFFELLRGAIETGKEPDFKLFDKSISTWEWQWVNSSKTYPVAPAGSSTVVAQQLYEKYRTIMGNDLK
jgi:alpha-N-acetylglucosaminidase